MLTGFRFAQLLRLVLLSCAFLTFFSHYAEAEEALTSWYGPGFYGKPTASGVPYDPNGYTAANKTLPLGTRLLVSYEGRTVLVTVNDRGPYVPNRDLDLSQAAAQDLGLTRAGVDYVDWRYANGLGSDVSQGAPPQDLSPSQAAAQPGPTPVDGSYDAGYSNSPSSSGFQGSNPAVQGGTNGVYVVQPGDTLSGIATQLGIPVGYLASYNGIADPNVIYSGQMLHLPTAQATPAGLGAT